MSVRNMERAMDFLPAHHSSLEDAIDTPFADTESEELVTPVGSAARARRAKRACVAGLLTVGALSALVAAEASRGAWATRWSSQGRIEGAVRAVEEKDCHDAKHGERCHTDVVYAIRHRNVHPEWYIGLNNCSTFADFQAFMHTQVLNSGERRCPKPCGAKSEKPPPGSKCLERKKEKDCHTAVPGDNCYAHMVYTQKEAIKYPKWYPGLSEGSSLSEIQHYLHQENVCPEPCDIAERQRNASKKMAGCHTAMPGDTCYADILLAKHKFILTNKAWYPGLTKDSSNDEFQAFLHNQKHSAESAKKACPNPCNATAADDFHLRAVCKTAEMHDDCYESVLWGATTGLQDHPEWYFGLNSSSTFEDFQLFLHGTNHTKCHHVPCPCHKAVKHDKCWWSVHWVMNTGLLEHPEGFKGLSTGSTFEEVQEHIAKETPSKCGMPCKTFAEDHRSPWRNA